MIDTANDQALCFDSDLAPIVEQALRHVQRSPLLIELTATVPVLSGAMSYEEMVGTEPHGIDWLRLTETEPFGLCFTSGTTGHPKGVMYTHRSTVLHAMACCSADAQALSTHETVLPVVPLFHANGWGLPHSAPMAGARLVMPGRRLDAVSLIDLCQRERVSFVCGVPTIWQMMLDELKRSGEKLSTVRRAGMGGAAPSQRMVQELEAMGMDVFHAWGMTETNPGAGTGLLKAKHAAEPLADRIERKRGQGRAIFGLQRGLFDESGAPLAHDGTTPGRLMVRGNWVVAQYLNGAAPVSQDDWFDTGDLATIDADGGLRIVDRAKDLIKSGGEWISSVELENVALAVSGVAQVAALGRPDEKWGERPVLVVRRQVDVELTGESLLAAMASRLARWQLPDEVIFWSEMPLTATGKIDKKRIRAELFGASTSAASQKPV
jgi:fatty-acyl-CoA synthase